MLKKMESKKIIYILNLENIINNNIYIKLKLKIKNNDYDENNIIMFGLNIYKYKKKIMNNIEYEYNNYYQLIPEINFELNKCFINDILIEDFLRFEYNIIKNKTYKSIYRYNPNMLFHLKKYIKYINKK